MVTLAALAAIPAIFIVLLHLGLYIGIFVIRRREMKLVSSPEPVSATVVVPARNEARLLPKLFASLDQQSSSDFAIILVDDRSSDGTGVEMDRYAEQNARVTVVHLDDVEEIGNPKLYALIRGVELVETDVALFTDADCTVPKGWVEEMKKSFSEREAGVVLGPIETRRYGTIISEFHNFDHVFKYAYTAGCVGINQATGGFGNNLGLRKAALDEIGGMDAIEVSVTEDAALVSTVRKYANWKILARFDRSITVTTEPQANIQALTAQEVRWHTGGLYSSDLMSRLSYRFIMFFLTASVIAIPVVFFVPIIAILPAVSFITMSLIAILSGACTRQTARYFLNLLPFVFVSMVYNSFLTLRAMSKPTLVWKGEPLSRRPR